MILLDTHCWVWLNIAPNKLQPEILALAANPDTEFAISTITVWEVVMLTQRGRISSAFLPEAIHGAWTKHNPAIVISIDAEIARLSRTLALDHSDPADRFIAATAFHLNCPLATVDSRLKSLPWLKTI